MSFGIWSGEVFAAHCAVGEACSDEGKIKQGAYGILLAIKKNFQSFNLAHQ